MDDLDTQTDYVSPLYVDYDDLIEHIVQGDHELLYLDTYLREMLAVSPA